MDARYTPTDQSWPYCKRAANLARATDASGDEIGEDARSAKRNGARQLVLDLQPDAAGLRDRAARLKDDAEAMSDGAMKAGLNRGSFGR